MLRSAHDETGHRGFFATRALLHERFWWPDMDTDVNHYVRTCHRCQLRQKALYRIPPVTTYTPSIFQVLHADTMHMTPASKGCKYIVHGRCALTSWMEGRALQKESAGTIGRWLFEDIICRWGCIREIVTDNGSPFVAAVKWLNEKYEISGIKISPYNSRANGKVERAHWDVRQMLAKVTGGRLEKWASFFHHIMWADRVSVRKSLGCSPFFMVTGAHPVLPLDILEATWLVDPPDRILSTAELIAFRAKALAKHQDHVEEMRKRVDKNKKEEVARIEREYKSVIKDYNFTAGALVLIRNSEIESSLDKKMKPRYNGPVIVVRRTKGGAYMVCELDGSLWAQKVAAFRVIPYLARKSIKLPDDFHEIIGKSKAELDNLETIDRLLDMKDLIFEGVRLTGADKRDQDESINRSDNESANLKSYL